MFQVIGEASHLSGYSFSAHNNIIDPSAELGSKTTVSHISICHLQNIREICLAITCAAYVL